MSEKDDKLVKEPVATVARAPEMSPGPALNDPVALLLAAAEALERRRAGRLKTYGLLAQDIRKMAERVEEIG